MGYRGVVQSMRYREVIRPPWWTYGVAAGLTALICFNFAAVITVPRAIIVFCVLLPLCVWAINTRRLPITVDEDRLCVGKASLPLADIGEVTPLDAAAMQMAAGPQSDARARLILRNLSTKQGVKVELTEGSTPYWLISSRHPDELAAALSNR